MKVHTSYADDNQSRPLIIFGAGGHAVSVANVALSAGYKIRYFIDKSKVGLKVLNYDVIESISELKDVYSFCFAVALGDNFARERVFKELSTTFPDLEFPALIHPSAVVSFFAEVGAGTVLMPRAVIGPNSKVGSFCLLNTQSSIDHDCVMLDFASLAPGAVAGGNVTIGMRSAVSIGATIRHGVAVGNDSVVGASSYLNKNLPDNQIAYGTPARQIRGRHSNDPYL